MNIQAKEVGRHAPRLLGTHQPLVPVKMRVIKPQETGILRTQFGDGSGRNLAGNTHGDGVMSIAQLLTALRDSLLPQLLSDKLQVIKQPEN